MNVIEWFFGYEAIEFYGMPCCVLGFCIMCLLLVCLLGIVLGCVYACTASIIRRIARKVKYKKDKRGQSK